MRKKTVLLAAVGSAAVALLVWMCWPSDYNSLKPTRLGMVNIPDRQITVSLFCKSQPRAGLIAPYEGEYRILEVAKRAEPPQHYDLPNTIPADTCHFDVFWYPTNGLVRFQDSGLTFDPKFRSETILDLEKRILYSVVRHQGRVYTAKLSTAMPTLAFPRLGEKSRVPSSSSVIGPSSNDPAQKIEIMIGDEVAKIVDDSWTRETGVVVGTIAP